MNRLLVARPINTSRHSYIAFRVASVIPIDDTNRGENRRVLWVLSLFWVWWRPSTQLLEVLFVLLLHSTPSIVHKHKPICNFLIHFCFHHFMSVKLWESRRISSPHLLWFPIPNLCWNCDLWERPGILKSAVKEWKGLVELVQQFCIKSQSNSIAVSNIHFLSDTL